ncbi:MAG TPA: hypothetical protein VFS67_21700 [Polyangiaceae bacterium]|nr:hypothetical protein [Polyangiaceae bacterium]
MNPQPAPRQLELLRFIHRFRQEHDFMPTHREMGQALGILSTNGVNDHLVQLERKGFLVRHPRLQRALRLTEAGLRLVQQAEHADDVERWAEQQDRLREEQALCDHINAAQEPRPLEDCT